MPTITTETQLALSAAPAPLRQHAGLWVRTAIGYKHSRVSGNGFDCIVELETPDSLEPECFDSNSARALIPVIVFRREQEALGISSRVVDESVRVAYASGRFRAPRSGDLVFMLSSKNRVFDPSTGRIIRFPPHIMITAPYKNNKVVVGTPTDFAFVINEGQPSAMIIVPVKP